MPTMQRELGGWGWRTGWGMPADGFTPLRVPNLIVWLQADTISGLSDGDPIGTWSDLSGNGYDAVQASASKKPTFKTNIINGQPIARGDGTDDNMAIDISSALTQPHTLFIAGKHPNINTGGLRYLMDATPSRNIIGHTSANPPKYQFWAGAWKAGSSDVDTNPLVLSFLFDGANSEFWKNGASEVADNPGATGIGKTITIFGAAGTYMEFDWFAYLLYDGDIGATNRGDVEKYLADKLGVTLA